DLAKERLRIPDLWRLLGLPGEPKACCRSPFRKEKRPSFSIFDEGRAAFDHGTGEAFDGPKFFAKARGLPMGHQALAEFVQLAGGDRESCEKFSPQQSTDSERRREAVHQKPDLSKFRMPSKVELHAIARDRGLCLAAPEIAKRLGCLKCGSVCGFP